MNDKATSSRTDRLAREIDHTIAADKVLSTVLGAVAIFCLLVIVTNLLLSTFTSNHGYRLIRAKWALLEEQTEPADILVLGDSSANQGINTDLISTLTGLSALNLATNGAVISVNDYWMLDEYIKQVGPPGCVILGHVLTLWDDRPSYMSLAQLPISVSLADHRVRELEAGYTGYARILVGRYFRAFTENRSLRAMLMYPWRGLRSEHLALSESGFFANEGARPDNVARDSKQHLESIGGRAFRASRDNEYSLSRIAALADAHGINLYVVNGPIYEGLISEPAFASYVAQVNSYLRSVTGTEPGVELLFEVPLSYSALEMQNADHLVIDAANRYTRAIVEQIQCGAR